MLAVIENAGFDDETTAAMGAAFDTAWHILKTGDPLLATPELAYPTKHALARFLIELARQGVKDAMTLTDSSVARMREHLT